jgi:hypothetical protein
MDFISVDGYKASIQDNGMLKVWAPTPPRVMEYSANGVKEVHDRNLDYYFSTSTLFTATVCEDGGFFVDRDAGFQRWNGWMPALHVGLALRNCGFSKNERRRIYSTMRKHPAWDYCPQHW